MSFDVAIIGGGLIGLFSAYELLKQKAKIVIIDKGRLGGEASSAGGGILSALPPWNESTASQQLHQLSQKSYPEICAELEAATSMSCDYLVSGMLVLQPEHDDQFQQWIELEDTHAEIITNQGLAKFLKPACEFTDAILLPDVAQVNNPKLIDAMKQYLIQQGVEIIEQTPVLKLDIQNHMVSKLITKQANIVAENFVLAAGAWSGDEQWNTSLNIKPIRGQMISYSLEQAVPDKIVLSKGMYCIPRKNHQLIVGSTLEDVGFDATTTEEAKQRLSSFAKLLFPQLIKKEPNHHWSGLRPGVLRDGPIIARHKNLENVYINTGHFRNGILAAPGSGKLVSQLLLKQPPMLNPVLFDY